MCFYACKIGGKMNFGLGNTVFRFNENEMAYQDGKAVSSESLIKSRAEKMFLKNENIHLLKAKALKDLCIKPKPGEHYRIITEKQFNAYAFILYLLESEIIEELSIAIYRINQPTVESLINMITAGKIKKANFVISNFFNQTKKPEQWAIMLREFCENHPNTSHAYIHNHSKVVAAKCASGFYVFEGSGNMSDNARIEQYIFENNKLTYQFHTDWIKQITHERP